MNDETESKVTNPEVETPANDGGDTDSRGREAAKYRRRLRDTEAERDALKDQLTTMRRQAVDQAVAEHGRGVTSAAMWAAGVEVDELIGDDGSIDTTKVLDAIESTRTTLGIASMPAGPSSDGQGNTGVLIHQPGSASGWVDAFSPERQ